MASADGNPAGAPHDEQWAKNVLAHPNQAQTSDLMEAQSILQAAGYTPDQINQITSSGNPAVAPVPLGKPNASAAQPNPNTPTKTPTAQPTTPPATPGPTSGGPWTPTPQFPGSDPGATDWSAYANYGNPYTGQPVDWTNPIYHDFHPKAAPPQNAAPTPPNNPAAGQSTAAQPVQQTADQQAAIFDPLMRPGSMGQTPDQGMGQLMAQRPAPSVDPLMHGGDTADAGMGQALRQSQDQANAAVAGQYAGVPGYAGSWLQRGGYNPTAAAMLYQDYINPQSQADQDQFMRNFLENTTGSPTAYNSDITYQMMKAYPTLNILDNPGIPVNPDAPSALIGAGTFGKQMMTPGASMPSASAYLDKLFSPEMVQNPYFNPTASGPGSGGSSDPTQMQIDRVYGAVKSLEPFMSKEGAAYIENNLQAAEAAYKDGLLRSDPTISKMSFLEYLDAIGADQWM